MTLQALVITGGVMTGVGAVAILVTLITATVIRKKAKEGTEKKKNTGLKILLFAGTALGILGIIAIVGYATIDGMAKKHGAFDSTYLAQPISKTMNSIKHGYIEDSDTIPKETEDLYGKIIIFFKFGCPDCEAIHDALDAKGFIGNDSDDIYFVSSKSELGNSLLTSMDIELEEVPSILYIKKNEDIIPYTLYILYKKENKKSVLDEEVLDRIIELHDEGR